MSDAQPEYYYEDSLQATEIINAALGGHALRPPRSRTPQKMISARISEEAHAGLQALAIKLGYMRADQGNVSMLLEAIGTGTVNVTPIAVQARRL